MWWTGILGLLVLVLKLASGQSSYDCKTYDKRPGRCVSFGHCRDLCPGSDLSFLRFSLAIPFDDPACATPGIMSNARQVCCPKLKCPEKVQILNLINRETMEDAENHIRTRRSDTKEPINNDAEHHIRTTQSDTKEQINNDAEHHIRITQSDTKEPINTDALNYYIMLFNRSNEDIRHHTTYITHTVYHNTRFTVVQTSTQTHFHTYDVPDLTTIISTVEFFTTLPVTHVTRSTITALPNLPTLTTTMTNLISVYTEFSPTMTFTTTVYGHTIDKTSTLTPLCDEDMEVKNSSLLSTKTHTVAETITSTRTTLRTHVTSHYLYLTSYRSTTYISTVTQTRVIMPTQVIYTTITADVAHLTKTAHTTTVNVNETLNITSTLPIGTHTLTETVYSSVTAQYHTVTATDCIKSTDTESEDITTEPSLASTTEDITPTHVTEEVVNEELTTLETTETATETTSETATESLMTTNTTEKTPTTSATTMAESTTIRNDRTTMEESATIRNDIEQGTRTKNNAFCAIPSKKEKYAKLKVINCGMDQKNVLCRKKDGRKLPENSVVLVTCYGSFTQRAKCGHDSKWRPYQINSSNNFTESFTLCDIPEKQ